MTIKHVGAAALALALFAGTQAQAAQDRLVLGGNPPGSLFYSLAAGIATVLSKHTGMKTDVFPEGQTVFFPMMMNEEVDIGIVNPIDAGFAYRGEAAYEKPTGGKGFQVRTLMAGTPMMVSLVTRKDSGVKTLADLKGRKVVTEYGAFFASALTARAVLANAGLGIDDVQSVKVTNAAEGPKAVIEGRADAAIGVTGQSLIDELNAAHGALYLEVDPSKEAMARSKKVAPGIGSIQAPARFAGIEKPTMVLSYPITLMARASLDDETAYKIVKALWEHNEELGAIHVRLKQWTPDRFVTDNITMPYHPGAIRFYKEKGVWTKEAEAAHAEVSKK